MISAWSVAVSPHVPGEKLVANSEVSRRRGSMAPLSRFVRDEKSEADREQVVLLTHRRSADKAEALAQPQHGLGRGSYAGALLARPKRRGRALPNASWKAVFWFHKGSYVKETEKIMRIRRPRTPPLWVARAYYGPTWLAIRNTSLGAW